MKKKRYYSTIIDRLVNNFIDDINNVDIEFYLNNRLSKYKIFDYFVKVVQYKTNSHFISNIDIYIEIMKDGGVINKNYEITKVI